MSYIYIKCPSLSFLPVLPESASAEHSHPELSTIDETSVSTDCLSASSSASAAVLHSPEMLLITVSTILSFFFFSLSPFSSIFLSLRLRLISFSASSFSLSFFSASISAMVLLKIVFSLSHFSCLSFSLSHVP